MQAVKNDCAEQDPASDLANSLSRVEAVLAEARDADSDGDNFAETGKHETDSEDDVPLSALEPSSFVNSAVSTAPSTSTKTETSTSAQQQASG